MPDRAAFASQRAITSVLAHEAVHATGAQPRLAREFGRRFGDRAYAVEEIVAELGAAMLLGTWGYRVEERQDHAQYVASWLQVLREQPRAIMNIASAAQKAADFLLDAAGAAAPSVPEAAE
jgi:antirestriction protein ArdC